MNNKIKIYCIFFDTMPLVKEIIQFAKLNKMQLLLQVGNCFTTSSLISMFTAKMPSDLLDKGIGSRTLRRYRKKEDRRIYVPWHEEYVTSKLSKHGWHIHIHNFPPLSCHICGDTYTDSFKGGYEQRYSLFKRNYEEKKKINCMDSFMGKMLFGDNEKSHGWYNREYDFIRSIQDSNSDFNNFYFIEYEHWHNFRSYMYNASIEKTPIEITKIKPKAIKRTINLMNQWNFNEPNSFFWFFSDHGDPADIGKKPNVKGYMSWVLLKDNTENPIKVKTKIISIKDFFPTILKKNNFEYKSIKESMPIDEINDKNRIFFVEDGRSRINNKESTSFVACIVVEWKEKDPIKILQVAYSTVKNKYKYGLNFLTESGISKRYIKLKKENVRYKETFILLKKELQDRFKHVLSEEQGEK